MGTIKFDPETKSFEIIDKIVQTIRDKVKAWADGDDKRFAEFRDNNIEECTDFVIDVENGLNERLKTVFLCEIGNEFERQTDGGVFQSDPFNESFLKRACMLAISNEWAIDTELLEKLLDL
jgi:hypothetical protein